MRISIICFSLTGYMTAEDLQKDLQGKGMPESIIETEQLPELSFIRKVNISMIRLRKVQESGQAAILRQMMRLFLSEPVESRCAALHLT